MQTVICAEAHLPQRGISKLIALAEEKFELERGAILSHRRQHYIAHIRQLVAVIITRQKTYGDAYRFSMPVVARCLGLRDHTTVLHARRAFARRAQESAYWETWRADLTAAWLSGAENKIVGRLYTKSKRTPPVRHEIMPVEPIPILVRKGDPLYRESLKVRA